MASQPRRLAAVSMLIGLLAAGPARAQIHDYELTIESDYQVRSREQPKPREVHATSKISYRVEDKAGEQLVSVHAVEARVGHDEEPVLAHQMSHAKASFRQAKQPEAVFPRAKAPPKLLQTLDDFDRPALSLQIDPDGVETGRKVLLNHDSLLVAHGLLDNCRLFHAPFPRNAERWSAPVRLSLSAGQTVEGRLAYEKIADGSDPGDAVRVRVTGELKGTATLGDSEIRNAVFKVEGEATYSAAEHAWLAGRLRVETTFDLFAPGEQPNTATGTTNLSLRIAPRGDRDRQPATAAKPGREEFAPRN